MLSFIENLFQVEVLITALVGFAAFGTVLTIAAPYFEGDKLSARIKGVSMERDRLRAQQKAQLIGGEARLREKPKRSLVSQIVESLNLRSVFEAEASRESLRQAGMRSERQLITFLALRLITPIIVAAIVFIYSSTVFADRIPPQMRLVATIVGLVFGF
ncbi:unnamed protein product, partial [Phaeothamnion confervicola]